MKHSYVMMTIMIALAGVAVADTGTAPLSAEEVVSRVLDVHPGLSEALEAVEEAKGHALQEGLWPNPEFEFGGEGIHSNRGGDLFAGIAQHVPLFGSRALARKAAESGIAAADQQALQRKKELTALAKGAFYNALAAVEERRVAETNLANAAGIAEMTRQRFEAGDTAEMDWLRASADETHHRAELEVLRFQERTTLAALALLCNIPLTDTIQLEGILQPEKEAFPATEELATLLEDAPGQRAVEFEAEEALGEVKSLKREALPEPDIHVGWRQERSDKQNAVDFTISFDLPLFNRNQGAIAEARARARRLEAQRRAQIINGHQQALSLWGDGRAALAEAEILRAETFPKLEEALEALQTALRLGGISLFEVLAAQQEVAEMRIHLLDLDRRARKSLIELEALL